jgi:hypothetical protein
MAHWLGHRLTGFPLQVIHHPAQWPEGQPGINYSTETLSAPAYHIWPNGLLSQSGIRPLAATIDITTSGDLPAFFAAQGGQHPFDLLAASFYLLSRYEEYEPMAPQDSFGRFSHTGSILHLHGWLKRPLIDEWIAQLKAALQQQFPGWPMMAATYRFTPTYDVDVAWSYLHKGAKRSLGGMAKDLLQARWKQVGQRVGVWLGIGPDPFDSFAALQALHTQGPWPAHFFLLAARQQRGYDKNIAPRQPALQQLFRQLQQYATVGLHASWAASEDAPTLAAEKAWLEQLLQQRITSNRMHYLHFSLPATYEQLIALGITSDYSMGYGGINGFRAGTSHPFYWYHLPNEESTMLQVFPFGWMDANSRFEQRDTPEVALQELQEMQQRVQQTGGHLIAIWHQHLMANDADGHVWWQLHTSFLRQQANA